MKIIEKQLNLVWTLKEVTLSETCKALVFRDLQGILPDKYEVSDGKNHYQVSQEVFDLFMEAYFCGRDER